MAKIYTFGNNKGGVAKTTTTTNVAHGLALMMEQAKFPNGRVLVVDMDSQAHATLLLTQSKNHSEDESVGNALWQHNINGDVVGALDAAIKPSTWHPKIDVLCAHGKMNATEESLVGRSGNVFFLKRILRHIEADYDVILIDTCPKISLFTKMALMASSDVIIPVAPQYLDADGLMTLISEVNHERDAWESKTPHVTGIIVTKYSNRISGHEAVANEIEQHPVMGNIFLGVVPLNAEIEYSQAAQQSIFAYNMNCKGAEAYATITQKIAQKMFAKAAV
jgi:chromosome partitioning protein